jgi:hypothetical protein
MPGARCTRGLVCNRRKKIRTRAYRFSGGIRHSLRNGFTAYIVLSSVGPGSLSPSPVRSLLLTNLTPASGRQDHTTSPYASAPFVKGTSTSTASHPALVTIAKRPSYRDGTKSMYC